MRPRLSLRKPIQPKGLQLNSMGVIVRQMHYDTLCTQLEGHSLGSEAFKKLNHTLKRPRNPRYQNHYRRFSSYDDQYKYVPPNDPSKKDEDKKGNTQYLSSSVGTQRRPDGGPTDFFISHITSGGTPCDPAPAPFQLADFGEESLYTLVLLRHGESEWNKLNRYTGWVDVNLTEGGKKEARAAGRLLYENGIEIDHAFSSLLRRASFSCNMALNTAQQHWVPVTKTWRLNERHYGALQGYNKDTAFRELGLDQELVMQMRRSYDVRPPTMQDDHPYWHGNDRRFVLGTRL
jgi:Histidine phosphatase superfamily (branch 1)